MDFSGTHIRLAREVWERFTLREVIIRDGESVGLWVDPGDQRVGGRPATSTSDAGLTMDANAARRNQRDDMASADRDSQRHL